MSSSTRNDHEYFFEVALRQAKKAAKQNEVPIGAVLVNQGRIISTAFNKTESQGSFLAHAEMLCIQKATKNLKTKFLNNCELYITLEPCLMCFTAARLSRIKAIHYLAASPKFGRKGRAYFKTIIKKSRRKELTQQAVGLLSSFFETRR